jgi:hypothetical protein
MKYCEEYAALLDAFADGECTPQEADRVREHLKSCAGCRAYLNEVLLVKEAFPDVEDTEVPDGFADGIMAAVRANAVPRRRTMGQWAKIWLPRAACLALAVGVSCFWIFSGGGSAVSDATAAASGSAPAEERIAGSSGDFAAGGGGDFTENQKIMTGAAPQQSTEKENTAAAGDEKSRSAAYAPLEDNGTGRSPTAAGGEIPASSASDGVKDEGVQAFGVPETTSGEDGDESDGETSELSPSFQDQSLAFVTGGGSGNLVRAAVEAGSGSTYEERLSSLDAAAKTPVEAEGDAGGISFQADAHTEDGEHIAYYGEWLGTPHANQYGLYLILADGSTAQLPLPAINGFETSHPDSMWFDGDTFVYEITFTDSYCMDNSCYHVAGTYHYTVDLSAQTVSLEIR